MAKKKAQNFANIEDKIVKDFGDVIRKASEIRDKPPRLIPTTPKIDLILNGGTTEGTVNILTGPPGLGKTALALKIAANAQKIESDWGKRKIYYLNIEGRVKKVDLYDNHYLDPSDESFALIKSTPNKILNGEDFIDIGEQLIHEKPGSILIFDSFSALCTKERHEKSIKERIRDNAPLLLANFCKRISQVVPVNQNVVIGITHLIANQGPGMSQWSEASGRKLQYQADVKLKGTHKTMWESGDQTIGQLCHWQCEKSAFGAPGGKTTAMLRYKHGFDSEAEITELAVDVAIVKKAGAWFSYKDQKFQGLENFVQWLRDEPKVMEEISKEVREMYTG